MFLDISVGSCCRRIEAQSSTCRFMIPCKIRMARRDRRRIYPYDGSTFLRRSIKDLFKPAYGPLKDEILDGLGRAPTLPRQETPAATEVAATDPASPTTTTRTYEMRLSRTLEVGTVHAPVKSRRMKRAIRTEHQLFSTNYIDKQATIRSTSSAGRCGSAALIVVFTVHYRFHS